MIWRIACLALVLSIAPVAHAQQSADLSLTKAVNYPNPVYGSQVTFTVTALNSGPKTVNSLIVKDKLPTGFTYVSSQVSRGSYNASTGSWQLGLPNSTSATLTLVATVKQSGIYANVAEVVQSALPDPDSTPNNHNPAEDDYASRSVTPKANTRPTITGQTQNPLAAVEDTLRTIAPADLKVTDPDVPPQTLTVKVKSGTNYSFSGNTFTPNANYNGTLSVKVVVNDGIIDSAVFSVAVSVAAVNDAPVITGQTPNPLVTTEDSPLPIALANVIVTDVDLPPQPKTLRVLSGTNYSFTGNTITPSQNYSGMLNVNVVVNDGIIDSAPFPVVVSVTPVNDPPVITGQTPNPLVTAEDTPLTIALGNLVVTDPDNPYPTGFTLTVLGGTGYTVAGNQITPNQNLSGSLSVSVIVNDGAANSGPFNVNISVTPVNDRPVITGQTTLNTAENTPLTIELADLFVTDPDNAYPAGFNLSVLSGANYAVTHPGEITPDTNFTGTLTVPVVVNDGTDDSAPFDLVVTVSTEPNVPPSVTGQVPDPLDTPEDTALTLTLDNLTVTDPDDDYPGDFTLTVLPGAEYSVTGNVITPSPNYDGSITVPVIVNDGKDDSAPFDLHVIVTPVDDPPVIVAQAQQLETAENTPLTITLDDVEVDDPDNLLGELTLIVQPGTGYTLVANNEIKPDQDFTGPLLVPVIVSDGVEDSDPFDLSVTVTAGPAPNVVVIMMDDLDERTLAEMLQAGLLPNIQTHIVDGAVRFTDSFVTNPLCCPSRASFMSGLYSHNHHAVHNSLLYPGHGYLGAVGAFDDSNTLATRLEALGYTTGHIGKYLNGYGRYPNDTDVSPAFGPTYVPPGWTQWHATIDPNTYCEYDYDINHNGVIQSYDLPPGVMEDTNLYQTNVLAGVAEDFVESHVGDTAPFYLEIMPLAPHAEICPEAYGGQPAPDDVFARRIRPAPEDSNAEVPAFVPSPAYDEDTSDKPDYIAALTPLTTEDFDNLSEQYQARARAILAVDRLIGRVVAALGPAIDHTVLILTSDNGWLYGDHRLGEKIYAYDESSRVPLYIRLPGSTTPAQRDNLVINNDMAPTILNMVAPGYPDADFDGRSVAPLLAEANPPGWVERTYFLIEHPRVSMSPDESMFPTYNALRSRDTLYIETFRGTLYAPGPLNGLEWYNLTTDPYELQSILHWPQSVPDPALTQRLQQLKACLHESCKTNENAPLQ